MKTKMFIFAMIVFTTITMTLSSCLSFKRQIHEFILPVDMSDTELQIMTNSNPISQKIFLKVIELLTVNQSEGKKSLSYELYKESNYIFHVKYPDDKAHVFYLSYQNNKWDYHSYPFNGLGFNKSGNVFLYFNNPYFLCDLVK